MNIAFITPTFALGGYEKVVIGYANAFADLGHNITILCGYKEGNLLEQVQDNVNIIEFKARIRNFIIPLTNYLKKNKVDILYAPFRTYTTVAVIARYLSGNKQCVIYGSAHGYGKDNRLFELIAGRIMRQADVLTAVTQELAEYESRQLNIPIKKYRVFNNPVVDDSKEVIIEEHKWLGENKKFPVVVASGRLEKDKGKDVAIKIFAEVIKSIDSRMIILGTGSEMNALKQLALDLKVNSKIDFVGFVSNPMGYIIQCDVLLHPAEIEAFGNVIVEALFCDLPVVTTECKGPVEIIENGKFGINIGSYFSDDVILNGTSAILEILSGARSFRGLRTRALDFDAKYLEKDFIAPYYEMRKRQ